MPIKLTPKGTGRKDYTDVVTRIYQYTPKKVPAYDIQRPLFWYSVVEIPAYTASYIHVYEVKEGELLSVYYAKFSNQQNVLMTTAMAVNNEPYSYATFQGTTYYGMTKNPVETGHNLTAGETLDVIIVNPNEVPIIVNYYIQGIIYTVPKDDTIETEGFGGGGGSGTGGPLVT